MRQPRLCAIGVSAQADDRVRMALRLAPAACRRPNGPSRRQRGAVLLLLALAILAVIGTLLLGATALTEAPSAQDATLAQAAAMVAGHARQRRCVASVGTVVDHLPCPDMGASEGVAAAACPATTRGRLPWRTLGTTPLRDAAGECLWYERSAAGARVIAPGPALAGQTRAASAAAPVCGGHYAVADYLEASGNDVVLPIGSADLALPAGC